MEWSGVGWSGVGKSGVEWERGSDYRWEVLKFMKLGSQKTRQNDGGIAQVLCFARVIFGKVRQLHTKTSILKAMSQGDRGPVELKGYELRLSCQSV